MTPKAISFTPEVLNAKLRALEEYGRCQTRRPVRANKPGCGVPGKRPVANVGSRLIEGRLWVEPGGWVNPPFGLPGQPLWVRERALVLKCLWRGAQGWKVVLRYEDGGKSEWMDYPSRLVDPIEGRCVANGVFREGARHFLEVVDVRAERVAEISADDAVLEGINPDTFDGPVSDAVLCNAYLTLYDSIYGDGAHERDWCWVYTLKRAELTDGRK